MKSKGNIAMSKVITRKLKVGDRFKLPGNSYEVYEVSKINGDYLVYKNVNSNEEFQMVRGFAQTVDLQESADYQKKRFKEPAYMYKESKQIIKEAQERKKDYLAIVKRFRSDINKHIDRVERDIERGFAIDYSDRDEAQVLGTRFSAELLRYNLAVENKTLTENTVLITDVEVGDIIEYHGKELKVIQKTPDKVRAIDDKGNATTFSLIHFNEPITIKEGRIARGYENLDAEEKAKHLLSHPSSKYMNDLKSENITERAIRKAVKEMLGKPAKDDPQFIIDVNEEGEAPAIANTTAEVANPDLPLKLKEGYKLVTPSGSSKSFSTIAELEKFIDDDQGLLEFPIKNDSDIEKWNRWQKRDMGSDALKIVKEDDEALENHIKYQISVTGGMGTDAENAPSAKEHDDEVVMVKEHRSFRKFIKESK